MHIHANMYVCVGLSERGIWEFVDFKLLMELWYNHGINISLVYLSMTADILISDIELR